MPEKSYITIERSKQSLKPDKKMEKTRTAVYNAIDEFEFTGINIEVYIAFAQITHRAEEYTDLLIRYHESMQENIDVNEVSAFAAYVMEQVNA